MKFFFIIFILLFNISCRTNLDYIVYHQSVNDADSLYRMANKPKKAYKKYRRTFRKYEPRNYSRIHEYQQYIQLGEKFNKRIKDKELFELIYLLAPNNDVGLFVAFEQVFQKHGIDSIIISEIMNDWEQNIDKELRDSISNAIYRDQNSIKENNEFLRKKVVEKNFLLFKNLMENNRFPSEEKVGMRDGSDNSLSIHALILNLFIEDHQFDYLRENLPRFIKSGDFSPYDYAFLVDLKISGIDQNSSFYGTSGNYTDTVKVNLKRKSIGLPSIFHADLIRKNVMVENDID